MTVIDNLSLAELYNLMTENKLPKLNEYELLYQYNYKYSPNISLNCTKDETYLKGYESKTKTRITLHLLWLEE